MSMTAYIDERYDDTFESVYAVLQDLTQKNPVQAAQHIRQTLKSLYVRQGNDWTGRGAIGNAGLDASVQPMKRCLRSCRRHANGKE